MGNWVFVVDQFLGILDHSPFISILVMFDWGYNESYTEGVWIRFLEF